LLALSLSDPMPHRSDRILQAKQSVRNRSVVTGFMVSLGALILFYLLRRLRLSHFDPALILGSFFLRQTGALAEVIGAILFTAIAAFLGGVYGLILRPVSDPRKRVIAGFRLGLFHWMLTGTLLESLTAIHPLIPEKIPAPGFFGTSQGTVTALAIFITHLLFGTAMGTAIRTQVPARMYGTETQPPTKAA